MGIRNILFLINYISITVCIVAMIIKAEKKPIKIFAWSFVMLVFPFLGLLIYLVIGRGLDYHTKHMLKKLKVKNEEYDDIINKQVLAFKHEKLNNFDDDTKSLILLNLNNSNSLYTDNNKVKYYNDAIEMLNELKEDINNATKTINLMYYIFATDKTGTEIRDLLIEKAKQGVKIKVIYDAIGSHRTGKKFFKDLVASGGEVEAFMPSVIGYRLDNVNYRNHRKIVVIDGKIGYTGGINLRDDHIYGTQKSVWRDTHLRLEGPCVFELQNTFIADWRFVNKKFIQVNTFFNENYYGNITEFQDKEYKSPVQIINCSPATRSEQIKECFVKMISEAKKTIRIQSPYFIPDDFLIGVLHLALMSGVKVEIMLPKIPDYKIVWNASMSYAKILHEMGADIYLFEGFIHSKTLSVDDLAVSVGSCNFDIRSFALNFETNAVIYDKNIINEHNNIFEKDKEKCTEIDKSYFNRMNIFQKLSMKICKLFSSIF